MSTHVDGAAAVSSPTPRQRAVAALSGRREAALLELPSVARTAELVAERCREPSWVRTTVATLDRFSALVGCTDLEELLADSRRHVGVAETALRRFAAALDGRAAEHIAALAFGAKVWCRTNGVAVPWRPLVREVPRAVPEPLRAASGLATLGLIGSGLTAEELATVRVGDLGCLDEAARLVPDLAADPMAVRYQDAGDGREWVTFLSPAARAAVLATVDRRRAAEGLDPARPLVEPVDAAAARTRDAALIGAGNDVNVTLCRATGDFFRSWGMPGARFDERLRDAATEDAAPAPRTTTHPERRPR